METQARRSDRWAAEPERTRNWLVPLGAALVLTGYALAAVVGAAAARSLSLPDGAEIALVAAVPSIAALGSTLALVGARRLTLRALGWVVFAVGLLLVLASIAAVTWVLLALRSFS